MASMKAISNQEVISGQLVDKSLFIDLIGKRPMVYYTGKPIEKGIQTTSHTQNRLLICKQRF